MECSNFVEFLAEPWPPLGNLPHTSIPHSPQSAENNFCKMYCLERKKLHWYSRALKATDTEVSRLILGLSSLISILTMRSFGPHETFGALLNFLCNLHPNIGLHPPLLCCSLPAPKLFSSCQKTDTFPTIGTAVSKCGKSKFVPPSRAATRSSRKDNYQRGVHLIFKKRPSHLKKKSISSLKKVHIIFKKIQSHL